MFYARNSLLIIILLSTLSSWATLPRVDPPSIGPCRPKVESIAFTSVTELKNQLDSVGIMVKLEGNGNFKEDGEIFNDDFSCSSSYISDQGHILTASHCLDSCVFDVDGNRKNANSHLECEFTLNGKKTVVDVLMMSACSGNDTIAYGELLRHRVEEIDMPEKLRKCKDQADLAVIMPRNKAKEFKCMPINLESPIGKNAYTLGWPEETLRGAGDSNGIDLYYSQGSILEKQSLKCTPVKSIFSALVKKLPKELDLKSFAPKGHVDQVQTDIDFVEGSSGGPAIDEETGEGIGIASVISDPMGFVHNYKMECKGATFFQALAPLKNPKGFVDNFNFNDISCKNKNYLP
jgi:hypothetical protein